MDHAPGGFRPAQQAAGTGPYEDLTDNEVITLARRVHARFRVVARWEPENDGLIREWGDVLRELGRRGITDTVTEAGPVDILELDVMTEDSGDCT